MKWRTVEQPATMTLERSAHFKSGQEVHGFMSLEVDISQFGNHYTSMYSLITKASLIIHLLLECRSEGPAQVFFIGIDMAYYGLWPHVVDRLEDCACLWMCHLDNLRVAQSPLPLPGKLKFICKDIHEIIDDLHLKNHKGSRCAQTTLPLAFEMTFLTRTLCHVNRRLPGSAVSKRSYVPCQKHIIIFIYTAS